MRRKMRNVEIQQTDLYEYNSSRRSFFGADSVLQVSCDSEIRKIAEQSQDTYVQVNKKRNLEYYLINLQYELLSIRPEIKGRDRKLILIPSTPRSYVHRLKRRMNSYEPIGINPYLEKTYHFPESPFGIIQRRGHSAIQRSSES